MAVHILDAFFITFGLDSKGFEEGERDITDRSKRLRSEQKKTFDDIERFGRKTGESIKGLSREVIGLGLAFMGARSITGLVSNMMTGAAVADRFGQTLGMNARQVWAWRMAMKSVGGETAEGDAALSAVQRAKMGYRMGTMGADEAAAYGRLGISGNDLRTADAGGILSKLAGAQGKMDPQLYASLLQQIGLPASTIYFLQQGKDSVDKLLRQFEADASGQEALAKEQEQLQKSMAELTTTIQKELVPPLTRIAAWINDLVGGAGPETPRASGEVGSILGGLFSVKRDNAGWSSPKSLHDITMQTESGGNPNAVSPKGARGLMQVMPATARVPGFGIRPSDGSKADDVRLGKEYFDAMMRRYGGDPAKAWAAYNAGFPSLDRALKKGGGNWLSRMPSETRAYVAKNMAALRASGGGEGLMAMHRNFARNSAPRPGSQVNIQNMTVHTQVKDGRELLRDVRAQTQRRSAVAQSDRVVNP